MNFELGAQISVLADRSPTETKGIWEADLFHGVQREFMLSCNEKGGA